MRNRTNIYELMEKVNQYDEGRKSAYASGEDDGGEKNIINQLRKATNMSTFKVTFDDGKKQSVPINVAQAALDKAMRMKPLDRLKFQKKMQKSYKDMLSVMKEQFNPDENKVGVELDEDAKMAKQSDDNLKSMMKKMRDAEKKDPKMPSTLHMIKRIEKEMKKRGLKEEVELDETIVDFDYSRNPQGIYNAFLQMSRRLGLTLFNAPTGMTDLKDKGTGRIGATKSNMVKFMKYLNSKGIEPNVEIVNEAKSQGMFIVLEKGSKNKVIGQFRDKKKAIDMMKKNAGSKVIQIGKFATTDNKPADIKVGDELSYTRVKLATKIKEETELDEKVEYVEYKFKNERDAKAAKAYFDGIQLMSFDVNDDNIRGGEISVDAGNRDMTKYHKDVMKKFKPKVMTQESLDEKYDLYHSTFSGAMQHAYDYAKKKLGVTVDSKEIDSKVATGPRKPSEGKTNKYRLKGRGGNLQIQVYNKGGSKPFELNMYKEEVEMFDEGKKLKSGMNVDFELYTSMSKSKAANMAMNKEIRRAQMMKDYKTARAHMDKVQSKYSELGAQDSEPDRTIDKILGVVFGKVNMGGDKKLFEYVSKNEELDKGDEPKLKGIIKKLKKASDAHAGQAKDLEKAITEQPEHEITVGNYTTKHFHMCGSAQDVMKKNADVEGAEELTRLQDKFYEIEMKAHDAGEATDEQKSQARDLYNQIMKKAGEIGLADDIDDYMLQHIDSMEKGDPKLGFGRTDIKEEFELNEKIEGLVKKAEKSGMPYGILKQVYDRGMAAWRTGHRPGTTPQQWAFARVNSFVTKSKGTWGGADKDLASKVRGKSEAYEIGTQRYTDYLKQITPGEQKEERKVNVIERALKELDKLNPDAVKKKFKDRKDKDIDNDGDVDSSDKYLHRRRKAISKAVKSEEIEVTQQEKNMSMRQALAKVWETNEGKNPFKNKKEEKTATGKKMTKVEVHPKTEE